MKEALSDKYRLALMADKGVACPRAEIPTHPGRSEAHLDDVCGLSRQDLKNLERLGLAVRGYSRNYWESGDVHPHTEKVIPMGEMKNPFTGEMVEYKKQFRGKGSRCMWVLIKE